MTLKRCFFFSHVIHPPIGWYLLHGLPLPIMVVGLYLVSSPCYCIHDIRICPVGPHYYAVKCRIPQKSQCPQLSFIQMPFTHDFSKTTLSSFGPHQYVRCPNFGFIPIPFYLWPLMRQNYPILASLLCCIMHGTWSVFSLAVSRYDFIHDTSKTNLS